MTTSTASPVQDAGDATAQAARFREVFARLKQEVHRVFVGQDELVENVLAVLLSDGHILLEGVPGLGKTLLAHTLASALRLEFKRVQFTPDLMPADIVGTMVLHEKQGGGHELRFEEGPLVTNFVLADEINRATPKTQSALLEAMQERQISVGRTTRALPRPFIVVATQNPIEQEGTYPLPEAQLDRFLVKLLVGYPAEREYHEILERTTSLEMPTVSPVSSGDEILALRRVVRSIAVTDQVRGYAIRLVMATQPGSPYAPESVRRVVLLGASPRGAQGLLLVGKVRALLGGRFAVSCQDVRDAAHPVLRHRILLNYEGHADGVKPDDLIREVVTSVSELSN
jgi:MoxR-like ATPase